VYTVDMSIDVGDMAESERSMKIARYKLEAG